MGWGLTKGVFKGAGKVANAINPFNKNDTNEPTKAEIMKKFSNKESLIDKVKNKTSNLKNRIFKTGVDKDPDNVSVNGKKHMPNTQAAGGVAHAYNDVDGSGRRDGSWEDQLDKMKADKEKKNQPGIAPGSAKTDDKKTSIFDMLKGAMGILGSIGSVAGGILTGILAIKPMLSFIGKGVSGVISAVTGGFSMLGKVPELLSGIGTSITSAFSSLGKMLSSGFSAIKGFASSAGEVISSGVSKVKEVGGKVLEAGKNAISKVTPLFY
jgi:hypothetical protein